MNKSELVVHCKKDDYDVYIGRPSKWGNPFTHKQDGKTLAKYIVNSRKDAIDSYREWITKGEGQYLLEDLSELKGKVLGCWCMPEKPKPGKLYCHGQVLVELIEKYKI